MTKFVLFTTQRSGSTWVIDTLNQTRTIQAYGEQLLREKRLWDVGPDDYSRYFEIDRTTLPGPSLRPFSLFSYLNGLYQREGVVGFKLMYSALRQYPETWLYLHRHRVRCIHLVRENHLDVLISKKLVMAKGQAHQLGNAAASEKVATIQLEPAMLLTNLRWLKQKTDAMHRLLRFSLLPYLTVTYEELAQNPANFEQIRTFLGVGGENVEATSLLRKIRRTSYEETVENFADIQPILASSEFSFLLKEHPTNG